MIPLNDLIALFTRMYREHWAYKWGSAQTGCVDCSGAFVWAYRQFGQSIYQGSNRIARSYVAGLLPVSAARPGMAAFKARKPGQQYYDLPSEYREGGKRYNGDLNDYYHIGLVDSDPRYVLNAQGVKTGFVRSKLSDGWCAVGYLKAVDYNTNGMDDEMGKNYEAVVDSANDKPVNLRKGPGTAYPVIAAVKDGTRVTVLDEADGDWAKIDANGKTGYMMRGFLVADGEAVAEEDPAAALIRQIRDMADEFLKNR